MTVLILKLHNIIKLQSYIVLISWSIELILELIMLIQLQLVGWGNLPSANITGAPALQVVKLILHNAGLGKSPFQALNKHLFLVNKLGGTKVG